MELRRAQLCGRKQLRRLLARTHSENTDTEKWHSAENEQLTSILTECAHILWDSRSFGLHGHTTAVWWLEKYKNRIFAFDKNRLTAYTPQLEKLAVLAATDGKAITKIMVYGGTLREENTITTREDIRPFFASLNLNGAKVNSIATNGDCIAMVANNGMLYLYSADEGDVFPTDVIPLQNISVKNILVCGFTDRSIKLVDISGREKGRV